MNTIDHLVDLSLWTAQAPDEAEFERRQSALVKAIDAHEAFIRNFHQ